MEPTITELDVKKTLLNAITLNEKQITEVNIKKLILRPIMKRIVFITDEFDRVVIYDGAELFEAHKNDSQDDLLAVLLLKIDSDHKV